MFNLLMFKRHEVWRPHREERMPLQVTNAIVAQADGLWRTAYFAVQMQFGNIQGLFSVFRESRPA